VGYAGVHSVDPGVDAAGFQATKPSASGGHDKASYVSNKRSYSQERQRPYPDTTPTCI
jgi:hypothetical protein